MERTADRAHEEVDARADVGGRPPAVGHNRAMKALVLILLGFWLGALVASWVVASANFRMVDRVLAEARPEMAQRLAPLPPDAQRQVLRYLASENNRWMFGRWSVTQAVVGLLLVVLAWRLPGPARYVLLAVLILGAAQMLLARPIVDVGRAIDFVPRPLPPDVRRRFGLLHAAFVVGDLVKAALLLAASWLVARPGA